MKSTQLPNETFTQAENSESEPAVKTNNLLLKSLFVPLLSVLLSIALILLTVFFFKRDLFHKLTYSKFARASDYRKQSTSKNVLMSDLKSVDD